MILCDLAFPQPPQRIYLHGLMDPQQKVFWSTAASLPVMKVHFDVTRIHVE